MLRKILEVKGITPYKLWKMTGLSKQHVYDLLDKDLAKAPYGSVIKIADTLDLSAEKLVKLCSSFPELKKQGGKMATRPVDNEGYYDLMLGIYNCNDEDGDGVPFNKRSIHIKELSDYLAIFNVYQADTKLREEIKQLLNQATGSWLLLDMDLTGRMLGAMKKIAKEDPEGSLFF